MCIRDRPTTARVRGRDLHPLSDGHLGGARAWPVWREPVLPGRGSLFAVLYLQYLGRRGAGREQLPNVAYSGDYGEERHVAVTPGDSGWSILPGYPLTRALTEKGTELFAGNKSVPFLLLAYGNVHNQDVISRTLQQGPIAEAPALDSYAKTVVCEDEVSQSKSFCLSAC